MEGKWKKNSSVTLNFGRVKFGKVTPFFGKNASNFR